MSHVIQTNTSAVDNLKRSCLNVYKKLYLHGVSVIVSTIDSKRTVNVIVKIDFRKINTAGTKSISVN